MEGWIPATESGEIAEDVNQGRDSRVAWTGRVARAGHSIAALNRIDREILIGVHDDHRQADAIRDVVPVRGRVDPAYIEGVEWTAGLTSGIVLWHRDVHDVGVAVGGGGPAYGSVLHIPAAARKHKQRREKNSK